MLVMLRDLVQHKGFANAALLRTIRNHEIAASDPDLRKVLHHILVANRFWLALILGEKFAFAEELRIPESLGTIAAQYRETHARELEWMLQVQEPDLARTVESALIPGRSCSVAQAMMQVCLHSLGHRAQCASRLRELDGEPPAMDFIFWLKDRPAADWS